MRTTCAVLDDTSVRCWGDNMTGLLGSGRFDGGHTSKPTIVRTEPEVGASATVEGHERDPELRGARQVVVMARGACALMIDGTLRCWGQGWPSLDMKIKVSARTIPRFDHLTEIASSEGFLCLRSDTGIVTCGGDGPNGVVPLPAPATRLAVGTESACALLDDGTIACWPTRDTREFVVRRQPEIRGARSVSITRNGGCAELADGSARCWGRERPGVVAVAEAPRHECELTVGGMLRYAHNSNVHVPNVVAFDVGAGHVCALLRDGGLTCWGETDYGQVGEGTSSVRSTPALVPGVKSAVGLVVNDLSCARHADTGYTCWGSNDIITPENAESHPPLLTPVDLPALRGATDVSLGGSIGCELRAGVVSCWSRGPLEPRAPVPGMSGFVQIATTESRVCGLKNDRSVWCHGLTKYGPDGRERDEQPAPSLERMVMQGAVQVVAGSNHACARLATGHVRCWGSNIGGQLGDGSTRHGSTAPVAVVGIGNAVDLVAADSHTCAITSDHNLVCWGQQVDGDFGTWDRLRDTEIVRRPIPAHGLAPVVQAATVEMATCLLGPDGLVRCLGSNGQGELGDGTFQERVRPAVVPGLTNVVEIVGGAGAFCARHGDGRVSCWGTTWNGKLGTGERGSVGPTRVAL